MLDLDEEGGHKWEGEQGDKTMMAMVMPNKLMELPKAEPNSLLVNYAFSDMYVCNTLYQRGSVNPSSSQMSPYAGLA